MYLGKKYTTQANRLTFIVCQLAMRLGMTNQCHIHKLFFTMFKIIHGLSRGNFFLLAEITQSNKKTGGAGRDRTDDILLAKQALSQLSYSPIQLTRLKKMVGLVRFELTTSRLSSARSNQLSYKPALKSSCVSGEGMRRRRSVGYWHDGLTNEISIAKVRERKDIIADIWVSTV